MVGYDYTSSFVDDHGVFTFFNVPGAQASFALGINNQGDVVGSYIDASGADRAFLATPVPEPAAWAILLCGFGGLGAMLRARRARALAAA